MAKKIADKPYNDRTDLEKIQSQWVKLTGLHDRTDYSAAVVRTATAAEIAVNFALRREFSSRSRLPPEFVDTLLKWANGLKGKVDRLLVPILASTENHETVLALRPLSYRINDKRNDIAHRGEFCNKKAAAELISDCHTFVQGIVRIYEPAFELRAPQRSKSRAKKKSK